MSDPALWVRGSESCVVFDYTTVQNEVGLTCPLGIAWFVGKEKILFCPYDKPFIDQACSVKMGKY